MLTGSHSSGSNYNDNHKGGRGSESQLTKQEVSVPHDNEHPCDDGACLLGNKDSQQVQLAPLPSQAQHIDLSTSRQSFCVAMANPSDFFVDVM